MRILLSSLLVFAILGCASYPKKKGYEFAEIVKSETLNPYFSNALKDYVYKAKIETFDRTFGGIFIIKKIGPSHHRTVFTTEIGNTLFDFSFHGDGFKVNRILKEIDRKILVNILKRDFTTLFSNPSQILQTFKNNKDIIFETKILSKKHYFYHAADQLRAIVRTGSGKEKVVFEFSEIEQDFARKIKIIHKTFPLTITLNGI